MKLLLMCAFLMMHLCSLAEGVNIAPGGTATQSSTLNQLTTADKSIDGNRNRNLFSGSCSHTACSDLRPYWILCLGDTYNVTSVAITNPHQAKGRFRNIKIEVFETDPKLPGAIRQTCGTIGPNKVRDGGRIVITCSETLTGRYIKISKTSTVSRYQKYNCDALLMCEVEVTGVHSFECGVGFVQFRDTCFHISVRPAEDWFQARQACQAIGADLAIVDNVEENLFLKTIVPTLRVHNWIGATKLADPFGPTWQWLDPSANPIPPGPLVAGPGFEDWRIGEPSDPITDYCMTFTWDVGVFRWNDFICTSDQHYICEKNRYWPLRDVTPC